MNIAIIPARGASQRIPRKNIKPFHGQPMLAWSIKAALESGCFHKVIVSTDDDEIAMVARNNGAETPFVRPAELSDHLTGTNAVMLHALHWLLNAGYSPEAVCCIYATAPFIQAGDLLNGLQLLSSQSLDYVFSATSYGFPIQRAFRVNPSGRVEMCQPEHLYTRSQDLEETFHDAGQFYWGTQHAWLQSKPIFSLNAAPLLLPRHRVQDIDTPQDWLQAEQLFAILPKNSKE
jgi:N-acylneuraminate cytidylyltransferase